MYIQCQFSLLFGIQKFHHMQECVTRTDYRQLNLRQKEQYVLDSPNVRIKLIRVIRKGTGVIVVVVVLVVV